VSFFYDHGGEPRKGEITIMRGFKDRSSSTDEPIEFAREPNHGMCVTASRFALTVCVQIGLGPPSIDLLAYDVTRRGPTLLKKSVPRQKKPKDVCSTTSQILTTRS